MLNKIFILKNYILPGEIWPALYDIHIPPQLVKWGIVVNDILYYFIREEDGAIKPIFKMIDLNIYDDINKKYLIATELDMIFDPYDKSTLNQLSTIIDSYTEIKTIQIKMIELFSGSKLEDNMIERIISSELYSKSNQTIINEQINRPPKCVMI